MKTLVAMIAVLSAVQVLEAQTTVTLTKTANLNFDPVASFFLIRGPTAECSFVAPARIWAESIDSWTAAARLQIPTGCQAITWKLIVEGPSPQSFETDPVKLELKEGAYESADSSKLQKKEMQLVDALKNFESDYAIKQQDLRMLEAKVDDAASIKNLARLEDLLESSKRDLLRFSRSLEAAKEDLRFLKSLSTPRNTGGREGDLGYQMTLLASASRTNPKSSEAPFDLKQKIDLIEKTKYEQVDRLTRELERLRKERLHLETLVVVDQ